jgi:hypothetical protein
MNGLSDGELVLDLPAEPTPGVAHHRYREASLAVDEADGPLLDSWPFLLIVRTGRVVTSRVMTPAKGFSQGSVPPDTRSFQQIASCTSTRRRVEGQRPVHAGPLP